MYKKLLVACALFFSVFTLAACSTNGKKTGSYTVYDTKITKTSVYDDTDWLLRGTTSAPNGAKILVVPCDEDSEAYGENVSSAKDVATWAKVKNGKFSATVDGIETVDESSTSGSRSQVYVMAVTGYSKSWDSIDNIPSLIIKTFSKSFNSITLTLSNHQFKYMNGLNDSDNDDSSSESASASSSAASSRAESESISESIAESQSTSESKANSISASNAYVASQKATRAASVTQTSNDGSKVEAGASEQIIGNVQSHIYHVPGQAGYSMNASNAVYFNSEAEAQAAGYRRSLR